MLTPRFPLPECGGDLLRINHVARYLKSAGHELLLVSYTEGTPALHQATAIYDRVWTVRRSRWASVVYSAFYLLTGHPIQCGYYYSRRYRRLLRQVVEQEKPQLFVSHLIRMLPFIEKEGLQSQTIVEMTDALSKTYSLVGNAKGSLLKRFMYQLEKHTIGRYELRVVKSYPKVVLVSAADVDFLAGKIGAPAPSLAMHTNGVSCPQQVRADYDEQKICFVGNMVSLQNQDAVIHFARHIFPEILKTKPQARFYIVGNNPPKSVQALSSHPQIEVTGFVDDLDAFISDSCLAVAPIRIAAGIQNKVLVSMANGIPVVLTKLIAAAIPELEDGENCFICDDDHTFAQQCVALMDNRPLRNAMAQSGHHMVQHHYAWQAKLQGYEVVPPLMTAR